MRGEKVNLSIDPLGRPTVPVVIIIFIHVVRQSKNFAYQMIAVVRTVMVAEWIIDDTCLICCVPPISAC